MTPEQRDQYATDKRTQEATEQKAAIDEATKGIKDLPATIKAEIKTLTDALSADGITKAQIDEFKEQIATLKEAAAAGNDTPEALAPQLKTH